MQFPTCLLALISIAMIILTQTIMLASKVVQTHQSQKTHVLPEMLKSPTAAFRAKVASCGYRQRTLPEQQESGDLRELTVWEQHLPNPDNDPSGHTLDRAFVLIDSSAIPGRGVSRVVWFSYQWRMHVPGGLYEDVWDIAFDRNKAEAYVIQATSNFPQAHAKVTLYAINVNATTNPEIICLDRVPEKNKDAPGGKPWSEFDMDIPKPKNPVQHALPGSFTNVRAFCHQGQLYAYLTRSDEGRTVGLSYDLRGGRDGKWKVLDMPD